MRPLLSVVAAIGLAAPSLVAQAVTIRPVEQQVAAAVLPLPEEFRADATVLGYRNADRLEVIRQGSGAMICLADDPKDARFHVACYQKDLEPFMARGRELRAQGLAPDSAAAQRNAEVESGRLRMPPRAALWQMSTPADSMDWATNTPRGARHLYVVYIPGATAESTGLPTTPAPGIPWLMMPGTPRAHIMFIPVM